MSSNIKGIALFVATIGVSGVGMVAGYNYFNKSNPITTNDVKSAVAVGTQAAQKAVEPPKTTLKQEIKQEISGLLKDPKVYAEFKALIETEKKKLNLPKKLDANTTMDNMELVGMTMKYHYTLNLPTQGAEMPEHIKSFVIKNVCASAFKATLALGVVGEYNYKSSVDGKSYAPFVISSCA